MPAVLTALGVPGERARTGLSPAERVVVLLIDGLGTPPMQAHAARAPFLSRLLGSTAPRTTSRRSSRAPPPSR